MNCADAPRLLKERRAAANRSEFARIREIDAERWAHDPDEETCCQCWKDAQAAAGMGWMEMVQS